MFPLSFGQQKKLVLDAPLSNQVPKCLKDLAADEVPVNPSRLFNPYHLIVEYKGCLYNVNCMEQAPEMRRQDLGIPSIFPLEDGRYLLVYSQTYNCFWLGTAQFNQQSH